MLFMATITKITRFGRRYFRTLKLLCFLDNPDPNPTLTLTLRNGQDLNFPQAMTMITGLM